MGIGLMLLQVIAHERGLAAADEYEKRLAERLGAERKLVVTEAHPAIAILAELNQRPRTLAAMTTHGRTGLLEAILGSVAHSVVRDAWRPVLVYRPRGTARDEAIREEARVNSLVAPLDGSGFSERMVPHAVEIARALEASLTLVQVLSPKTAEPPEARPGDVLESSYVRGQAMEIKTKYGIEADWEVLHGDAADAICDYVRGRHDVMLAMSSHTRAGLGESILGSVTAECVQRAGLPVLVYHPQE